MNVDLYDWISGFFKVGNNGINLDYSLYETSSLCLWHIRKDRCAKFFDNINFNAEAIANSAILQINAWKRTLIVQGQRAQSVRLNTIGILPQMTCSK